MITFEERWKAEKKRLKAGKGPLETKIVWHCPWCKKDQPSAEYRASHTCAAQPEKLNPMFRMCERVMLLR